MIYKMYVLVDTVANKSDGIFLFRNDNHAFIELDPRLNESQRLRLEVHCIGEYDVEKHLILSTDSVNLGFIPVMKTAPTGVQTPLDSGSISFQEQKFLEKTSDIGLK